MENVVSAFKAYGPMLSGMGAICTTIAALISIPVWIYRMRQESAQLKHLESRLNAEAKLSSTFSQKYRIIFRKLGRSPKSDPDIVSTVDVFQIVYNVVPV
jgi:hypothetical protein